MATALHLLIVDEHAQVRLALSERLRRLPGTVVLGAVPDVASAVPLVHTLQPDIVLFEPKSAGHSQQEGLKPLLAAGRPVVVWTSWLGDDDVDTFLRAGARAVLLKDTNIAGLVSRLASIEA